MNAQRIRVERLTDYAWPYLAILESKDSDGQWIEEDAWGGDSRAEAISTLREENRHALDVKVTR